MGPAPVAYEPALVALAINIGGTDLSMYQPAGISGHAYETAPEYELRRVLKVEKAAADGSHKGRWVVCAEPIAAGKAGRVYVCGVCLANILNTDDPSAALYAEITDGQAYLTGRAGQASQVSLAQVLWEASHNNGVQHLALIRFGGAAPPQPTYQVNAATTANITLSGAQTIDGVAVVVTNKVLVKNQTTPSENGLYTAAAGAWTKDRSFAAGDTYLIVVLAGTTQGGTAFYVSAISAVSGVGGFLKS